MPESPIEMAVMKKPGPIFISTNSDEDGKKALKNAEWPLKAVSILLDIYVRKFAAGHGYLRGSDWEEVMKKVNEECEALKICKTVKQCRDKVDSLKRRYKIEKRKFVNGNEVTWPFFTKLDHMMGSVFKQSRDFETDDAQGKASLYFSHGDEEENERQDFWRFPDEDYYGVGSQHYNTPSYLHYLENNKAKVLDRDTLYEDGFNLDRQRASLKLSLTGSQLSTDNSNSSGKKRHAPLLQSDAAGKTQPRKRKVEPDQHPMRALADAVTGFSEVYARVELAKLEILTTMKLELAKLRRKRHKNFSKEEHTNSTSTSSG